jgi:hypothetical protein
MATEHPGVITAEDPEIPLERRKDIKDSAVWGTIACGAGLFSDGYLNAVSVAIDVCIELTQDRLWVRLGPF